MHFITGLPKSQGKDAVLAVIDRLSKYNHFIAIAHPFSAQSIAQIYFEHIFELQGMQTSIVCDRDPTFTSIFWHELFRLHRVAFNYSSAYRPRRMDGQTEVINKVRE